MLLQGSLSIERMCQLVPVSRRSFYRSLKEQQPADEELEVRSAIQQIALEHRRRYGYRRITAELHRRGMQINHKRVVRIMREDNLLGLQPQRFKVTTNSNHKFEVYLNLAARMKLSGINQLWVANITYICDRRLEFDLDPTRSAAIKKFIGFYRGSYRLRLRQNLRRINLPHTRKIHELRDVFAVIAVPCSQGKILLHKISERECLHGFGVNADDAKSAHLGERLDGPFDYLRRRVAGVPVVSVRFGFGDDLFYLSLKFFVLRGLVGGAFARMHGVDSYGVNGLIDADTICEFENSFHGILRVEVDRLGTLFAGHL